MRIGFKVYPVEILFGGVFIFDEKRTCQVSCTIDYSYIRGI